MKGDRILECGSQKEQHEDKDLELPNTLRDTPTGRLNRWWANPWVVQKRGDKVVPWARLPKMNVRPFLRSHHKRTNRFIDFIRGAVKGLNYQVSS